MPKFDVRINNGLDTASDELSMEPGYLRACRGLYFKPHIKDQLSKMFGRSLAGSTPSVTTFRDLDHANYVGASNQLIAFGDTALYETAAANSLGAWSAAQDAQTSPADFSVGGSFLKAIPDGTRRVLCLTGAASERPLVRDADGNWRRYGLRKPSRPSLSSVVASTATITQPDSDTGDWSDGTEAYDDDEETAASTTLSAAGTKTHTWSFAGASSAASDTLFVKIASSSVPLVPDTDDGTFDGGGGTGGGTESFSATLRVEVSEDQTAGTPTWETIFFDSIPVASQTLQFPLSATSFNDLAVRATLTYFTGTAQVIAYVVEIYTSSGGSATAITEGNYQYAITEVYKETLSSGDTITVESAHSDILSVAVSGTKYGVILTLPTKNNPTTDGVPADQHYFRVYRSVVGGAYPNLGLIGEVVGTSSTFDDDFTVSADTLGSPGLNLVSAGALTLPAAGEPPAIRDAALWRGSLVCIDADQPDRIAYSLPGFPEYFPVPAHSFSNFPADRSTELKGITVVNDVILVYGRNRVWRIRNLAFAGRAGFDLSNMFVEVLSPNIGLAGTPKSHCLAITERGHGIAMWVSDNGIWAATGGLASEDGFGVRNFTLRLDWEEAVDVSRLDETTLEYDPTNQIVWFSYYDPAGDQKAIAFHIAQHHWVQTGADQVVPKMTGPHNLPFLGRAVGEDTSDRLRQWTVYGNSVYNEGDGTADAAQLDGTGQNIISYAETGWAYPVGPDSEVMLYTGSIAHNDWGRSETLDIDVQCRRDETGVIQHRHKKGIPMYGTRNNRFWLSRSAQSIKLAFRHVGQSDGSLGPFIMEAERMDEIERD